MADVAPQGFTNFLGPGLTAAETSATQADTALNQQRVQQATMDTQVQRATMPFVMQALNEMNADQSGANPGNPQAGRGAPVAGGSGGMQPGADNSGDQPLYNADVLEDRLRNQNYIAPVTPQEQQMLKLGTALSMSPKTAAEGQAIIARMQTQRQMRMDTQTANNQNQMGNLYDASASVATVDPDGKSPGRTFQLLQQVDPADAAAIAKRAKNPDGTLNTELADALARKYANHIAGVSFLYAGRPHTMENGKLIDTASGKGVVGQDQVFTGATNEQMQKEYDHWNEPTKWTDENNREHQGQLWQAPLAYGGHAGKMTPAQSALAMDQALRRQAPGQTPPETGVAASGATQSSGAPLNGATGARVSAAKAARANQPAAAATSAPAPQQPGAPQRPDNGMLPGVDPRTLPRAVNPMAGQGGATAGTVGTKLQEGLAGRINKGIEDTTGAYADGVKMDSLITQAQREINNLKSNPRMVGPGSNIDKAWNSLVTYVSGQAPDALVNENELDKFLNQIGAQNVRQLLSGQRITNQEMMTFLTRGSPSTAMPLRAIEGLMTYLKADNDYSMRYNKTLQMAYKNGADPDLAPTELSGRVKRGEYVDRATNGGPTLGAGPAAKAAPATVRVIHPDGHVGTLPAANLEKALAAGYKRAD